MYRPCKQFCYNVFWAAVFFGTLISGISGSLAQGQSGMVALEARIQERAKPLKEGVSWYIYTASRDKDGKYPLEAKYREATPSITLPAGDFLITATYGRAYLTRKITVSPDAPQNHSFIINAGGLSVTSHFTGRLRVKTSRIRHKIYSGDTDQFGNRSLVLKNIPAGKTIILNAGIYHIVSSYGDVNAIVKGDVTVEAGKVTKAALRHNAGHTTFRLVSQAGGEALPDTQWTLLSPVGEVIKKSVGALPNHILKAGKYVIRATRDGTTLEKRFSLAAGQSIQVEVIADTP